MKAPLISLQGSAATSTTKRLARSYDHRFDVPQLGRPVENYWVAWLIREVLDELSPGGTETHEHTVI